MTITVDDTALFAELRALKREWGNAAGLTAAEVARVKAALDKGDPSDLVTFGPAPNTLPAPAIVTPPAGRLTVEGLQSRLGVVADGKFGPASRKALAAVLTNPNPPRIGDADYARVASRLGVGVNIVRAVNKVEAPRGAFDVTGQPTKLYERHVANRNTVPPGRFAGSHPDLFAAKGYGPGGYGSYSGQFDKLADACFLDPEAAFRACSWGAFQVLGENAVALGYASAFDFALSLVTGEPAHLESFVRFVEVNGLVDELRAIKPGVPDSAIPFVSKYNGPGFREFNYHVKVTDAAK
jgi:hypothetical protein